MTNERINQIDQVAVVVRHTPGCVLQDICEALVRANLPELCRQQEVA